MKKAIFFIILLFSINITAQKQANIWYFGENAGLDFNSGTPVALLDGELNTIEGCATISDANGSLLFYTDGITVYNRNHTEMLNGTGLNGDESSSHSAIIIPKPGDTNIYYIFTVDAWGGINGLQYSEVDMTLDNGLGGITSNKNILLITPTTEKVTAVNSSIANEFWVLSHKWNSDEFIAYNVSSAGVSTIPIISAVGTFVGFPLSLGATIGQIKISPDGSKIAVARNFELLEVQLFDFNAATGEVSNPLTLIELVFDPSMGSITPYGIEFSPNSKLLYTAQTPGNIFQFNLDAGSPTDIINSQFIINSEVEVYGALQLATDQKIYVAKFLSEHLDVIGNPNGLRRDSDYQTDAVFLEGRLSRVGLPPFIQSFLLLQDILFENLCFGDTTNFSLSETVDSATWNFGDPASGANNTSTGFTPSHVFSAPGTYDVSVDIMIGTQARTFSTPVTIYQVPIIDQQPSDISACDIDNNGSETFDLTVQDPIILGSQSTVNYQVIYSTDPLFATTISDPVNYINTTPIETIYFRILNNGNTACFSTGSFMISISNTIDLPAIISDYEVCDDALDGNDTNGFVQNFVLSTKDAEILSLVNPSEYEVSYHLSENDAISDSNPIDKINPYTNTTAFSQTIFVRVDDIVSAVCNDTSKRFDLVVRLLPTVTPIVELRQCDTDTDGFSDFNLNEAASEISTNFINETFAFYPSLNDAQNDTNLITNPTTFTNRTVTTDTVWARTIVAQDCYRISEVQLIVSTTGIPSSFQRNFNECDDFLDIDGNDTTNNNDTDGITSFNFSDVTADVRALFPVTQQLIIAYYRNEADALAEQNAITDPTNYRNIGFPNSQQIYIRVDSQLDNDCLGLGPFITLTTDPVPTASPVSNLELCDDDTDGDGFNGFVQSFDLDSQTPLILGTQDPANYTVTYHTSANDARIGANSIATTSAYTNITANLQTIYIRVTENANGCFTDHTTFDLIVNPLPIANFVEDLEICDDDSDGSAQNGFSQGFDLESQTATILGSQDPTQFSVTYYASLSDAQTGILPLGSLFSNSVPFSQIIYVRVFNADTQCANGISNFNVIVNPEPTTENVSNLSFCDDDLDGDDTNGFVQNIDLDSQIAGILGPTQDINEYTVSFHENQMDATSGTGALASLYSNTTANQQTIYVRVLNNTSGCLNDDFTFDVIVDPLPDFKVTTPQIVCLNGPLLTIGPEGPAAVYDYVWTDPNGNTIIGQDITITSGGLYTVTAITTDGTSCSRTREIQVDESIIATLTQENLTIVDDSENNSITIDLTNLGIGDYEYALVDEAGNFIRNYQEDPFFENLEGGFYNILVRDKNECGTASLLVSVIEFPKFLTPNGDNINDTWSIKGANSTFFPNSHIYIFNRFGKAVAKIDIDGDGWDGTYNSKLLPSDDYWFDINLIDPNGVIINRKGNFSLLRK